MTSHRSGSAGGFAALNVSDALVAAVTALGYEEPTPVQRETIPLLLSGRDMLAQAATGTGKTAAFALPMLHRLSAEPAQRRRTRGLILVPTRELAMQVAEAIHKYARGSGIGVVPVYGGASMGQQVRALERGADIVVATPGRAHDLIRRRSLDLTMLQILVLDEADEMLDMGFAEDLDAILETTPVESPASALVFCRTRLEVDSLVETLNAHGYRAEALHGGMQQRQRDAVMNRFRTGKADLLIATDVAARGLDVAQLSHVFNYDLPSAPDAYVHRIGRTGRAGREGTAITLMEPRAHRHVRTIESVTRQKIEVRQLPTVADLRAKRLELTRASLRERLLQGDLDDVRAVIESLAEEFDVVDVAAAAVKLAQAAADGGREIEIPEPPPSRLPRGRDDTARIFFGAGRQAGIRPADLVGAITGEAGIASRELGAIQIADGFSLVEVPQDRADDIVAAMKKATLRGHKVPVRRDREDI